MQPEMIKRTLSREAGLSLAYEYFSAGRVVEAATLFCVYGDAENELQITTENEIKEMSMQFKELMLSHSLVELIRKGMVLPTLDHDNKLLFSINK